MGWIWAWVAEPTALMSGYLLFTPIPNLLEDIDGVIKKLVFTLYKALIIGYLL